MWRPYNKKKKHTIKLIKIGPPFLLLFLFSRVKRLLYVSEMGEMSERMMARRHMNPVGYSILFRVQCTMYLEINKLINMFQTQKLKNM